MARKAEEVGLDVFALGEHHNPPFFSSSPTTTLAYIAAQTERLILSTATTLITTNDPVKVAEDYATLQHLADGRVDLMLGRGNTGPVYPWFGYDIRHGLDLAVEHYALLVLEQLEILGGEIVPVLRRELGAGRPAHVPDAPTHQTLLRATSASDDLVTTTTEAR